MKLWIVMKNLESQQPRYPMHMQYVHVHVCVYLLFMEFLYVQCMSLFTMHKWMWG